MSKAHSVKAIAINLWRQKWFLPVLVLTLLVILLTIFSIFVANSLPEPRQDIFAGRDFKRSPFELTDAYDVCLEGVHAEHGSHLLSSYMDDLSTRYNEREKAYLVVVDINIGDGELSNAAKVYCSINPRTYQLTYYKEVHEGQRSLLSRTISFLSQALSDR